MQTIENTYQVGDVIQGRYLIEDILGSGGFSVVYLVRDQLAGEAQEQPGVESRFALKMLTDRDQQERTRFLFEGEILTRLHHPALPRIHRAFEDETAHRACLLMDYVEGTNLEKLRKRQPESPFSLAEALDILTPVVEALSYLHAQPSPIIHRDVKPANLIAREDGKGTALVDFGIAKEYEPDATTTAIRHCSPGYGALEQYSSIGTDQRTDIYGLAATLYVLLSNVVPVDALQRATKLASKELDPLVPLRKLVPAIPAPAADAIQRAMSIGMEKRFSSVAEFWQAVQEADRGQDGTSSSTAVQRRTRPYKFVVTGKRTPILARVALVAFALLLVGGLALGFGLSSSRNHGVGATRGASAPGRTHPITRAAGIQSAPVVARGYAGTIHDLLANATTTITLARVEQNNEQISGSFRGLHRQGTFTGVFDASRHLFFTVSGQPSLFFEGAIRLDGSIVGNYCTEDAAGQCVGNYGIWSLMPIP